jgi:ribosomal protein S18 acetylase RimI-like enzyme
MQAKDAEISESNRQYVTMWKVLSGDRPGADLSDRPGLSMCWADCAFPFWNAIFVTERHAGPELLSSRLRESVAYMNQKQHSGLVYVCEDFLDAAARQNLDTLARHAGLAFMMDIDGMAADIPHEGALPETPLAFTRVTDEAALLTYGEINAQGYGFAPEAGRAGLAGSVFWKSTAYSFIGHEDGQAVSTAAAIVNEGALYVALVATRPQAQCKGYGLATVRHALQQAGQATGLTRAVLHASPAGFPLYLRAGFHRTTRFLTYRLAD